jgi:hypothetical protein
MGLTREDARATMESVILDKLLDHPELATPLRQRAEAVVSSIVDALFDDSVVWAARLYAGKEQP